MGWIHGNSGDSERDYLSAFGRNSTPPRALTEFEAAQAAANRAEGERMAADQEAARAAEIAAADEQARSRAENAMADFLARPVASAAGLAEVRLPDEATGDWRWAPIAEWELAGTARVGRGFPSDDFGAAEGAVARVAPAGFAWLVR